ncbi:hypothetical protein [Candidatus Pseudothioglobus sp. Uisw_016]|uniref:hypothetical protein n=1 Tax=Candidatus Pseudothioglobus sp. Uisw_016 TaxID=3230995 RepID=UPI003A855865
MKDKEYKDLCDACDHVLLEDDSDSRMAISWLHILKWDPTWLENYNVLFVKMNMSERIRIFLTLVRYSIISLKRIIKGIWAKKFYINKDLTGSESDFLLISHLVNKEFINKKNDFYYGDIPNNLHDLGLSSTIAMINHIGIKSYLIPEEWQTGPIKRIVLSKSLSLINEVKIYYSQILEALKLIRNKNVNELHNKVYREAAIQALSNSTANNLRLKMQISDLLRLVKPRFIMVTYEGHAWERLIFLEARKIDPKIKCIGYQHALIKRQYAIFRDLGENYDPDLIATSGTIDLKNLEKKIKNNKIIKVNIGSSKKFLKPCLTGPNTKLQKNTCLVLADGDIRECCRILLFAVDLSRLNPNVHFIFRLHPVTDKNSLIKKNPILGKLQSNINWSYSSLEDDFEVSDLALYRATNAIYLAPSYNTLPVFFGNKKSMSIDPLFEIADIRPNLNETNQFFDILKVTNSDKQNILIKKILKYCNNKYSNLDVKPLIHILLN